MLHLRRARQERNISQVELAAMLGVGQPAVSQWENGLRRPLPPMRIKLQQIFGVPADVLLAPEHANGAPEGAAENSSTAKKIEVRRA